MQNDEDQQGSVTQVADKASRLASPPDEPLELARNAAGLYNSIGPGRAEDGGPSLRPHISRLVVRQNGSDRDGAPVPDTLVDLGRQTTFAPGERLAARNDGIIPKTISADRVFIKSGERGYDALPHIMAENKLGLLSADVQRLVSGITG